MKNKNTKKRKEILAAVAGIFGWQASEVPLNADGTLNLNPSQQAEIVRLSGNTDIVAQVNASLGEATPPCGAPAAPQTNTDDAPAADPAPDQDQNARGPQDAPTAQAPVPDTAPAPCADNTQAVIDNLNRATENRVAELTARLQAVQAAPTPVPGITMSPQTAMYNNTTLFPAMSLGIHGQTWAQLNAIGQQRPWNAHACEAMQCFADGVECTVDTRATFTQAAWEQLHADLKQAAFLTAPGTNIMNLDADWRRLPDFWPSAYNCRTGDTYAISKSGHVIQPFGDGFKPNNETDFWPEVMSLQKVELNYEFSVDELAKIEQDWLYQFNQPKGSANAFKMPFVRYILGRLAEMRDNDVREALFSGVWAPNSTRKPGYYLNSIDGLMYKIDRARGVKYHPFTDLGTPNASNIQDYVHAFCKRLQDLRGKAPMILYTTYEYVLAYRKSYAQELQVTIANVPTYVQDYPHVRLFPLDYLRGNFMFATDARNIIILNGDSTDERNLRTAQTIKSLQIAGQFNKGIHVGVFGKKFKSTDPVDYSLQRFFSNAEPIEYASVPAEVDAAELSAEYGHIIRLGANTTEVDITGISYATSGQPITILGSQSDHPATITTGSTFLGPKAKYSLGKGTLIRLMPLSGGKFAVMGYQANQPAAATVNLDPDATGIPSPLDRQVFVTAANTADTAIASIAAPAHPYDGFTITLRGGSDTHASTMATTEGKIQLSGPVTLKKDNEIVLCLYGEVWYETARKAS